MLCNSPGYLGFETSPFKLSAELMAIMDGADSANFEYFKELMVRGFLETRKHSERIILVLQMMLSGKPLASTATPGHRFVSVSFQDAMFQWNTKVGCRGFSGALHVTATGGYGKCFRLEG